MNLEDIAERIVTLQLSAPLGVLGSVLLLTFLLLPGIFQLNIKPSTEAILPADDPSVQSLYTLRTKFYGDTTYIVFESQDVRNQYVLSSLQRITNRLTTHEDVATVRSPATPVLAQYDDIPGEAALERIDYDALVSDDYSTGVMAVQTDTQARAPSIRSVHDHITTVFEAELPNTKYQLTGYNMIDLATFQVIMNDFATITVFSFAAVLTTLYLVFRTVKKMLLPLTPVLLALTWMLGIGGYLGVNLTIISMVSAAMIMGLGIDFGIHVTKHYYNTAGKPADLKETMRELSRGLLGGALTTSVGFLSLLFAALTGMHGLGLFLFTGILSAYIGAVILLPTIIILTEPILQGGT